MQNGSRLHGLGENKTVIQQFTLSLKQIFMDICLCPSCTKSKQDFAQGSSTAVKQQVLSPSYFLFILRHHPSNDTRAKPAPLLTLVADSPGSPGPWVILYRTKKIYSTGSIMQALKIKFRCLSHTHTHPFIDSGEKQTFLTGTESLPKENIFSSHCSRGRCDIMVWKQIHCLTYSVLQRRKKIKWEKWEVLLEISSYVHEKYIKMSKKKQTRRNKPSSPSVKTDTHRNAGEGKAQSRSWVV